MIDTTQATVNGTIVSTLHELVKLAARKEISHDGLGGGRSALALLYFYYGDCFNLQDASEKGLSLIEEIFANLENKNEEALSTCDLFSGITGLLCVLVNLKNNGLLDLDFADMEQLDKLVYDWAMAELDKSNIDFFYGATGVLSYFKERKDLTHDSAYLDGLTQKTLSLFGEDGAVIINRFYNQADARYVCEVNFSMAHGMVSVLNCLLDIYEKGFDRYGIRQSVTSGIEYIIRSGHSRTVPKPHAFANALNLDTNTALYQKRLGWCFSDLNILQLLYKAAAVLGHPSWKQLADDQASIVAARMSMHDTLVEDAFICHGAAGLAQYYDTLYRLSPQNCFEQAKNYWLDESLRYIRQTPPEHYESREYTAKAHIHSLFYGLPGVCLSLLSAYDPKYSSWSNLIML